MKNLRTKPITLFSILILLGTFITCSSDNLTDSDDNSNSGTVITPSITTASSMSWISLNGLPKDSNGYYGIVTAPDFSLSASSDSDTGFATIVRADTGDFMIMPLYPSDPNSSGEVQIVFTDGQNYFSEPVFFSIDSLPDAQGEFSAIVSLLQDVLGSNLRLAGLTRDSLEYLSPADIPLSRLPFVLAYGAIDDPTNPNSLRALADGQTPIINGGTFNLDLVDRILGETGIRTYFEELVTILDTTAGQMVIDSKHALNDIRVTSNQGCITAPSFGITNCGELASAMNQQYKSVTASNSAATKVVNDGIAAGLMIASLFPGVAVETAAIGSIVWGDAVLKDGLQNLLPSDFDDDATSFDPSKNSFTEDFTIDGNWSEFMVTATSNGWTLDKIAIETVLQMVGAATVSNGPAGLTDDVNGALKDMLKGEAQGKVIDEFGDAAGVIQICPYTWSNIDCVGIQYSNVVSNTGRLDIDSLTLKYKPNEVGSDIMRIETKNIFGQSNNTGTAISINTNELVVSIDPFQVQSKINKTINFTSRVTYATDESVTYSLRGGGTLSSDNSVAEVITPAEAWSPPLVLYAKSITNTGLRKDKVDSDPREDSVFITYKGGEFRISPESICLQPNQSQTFSILEIEGNVDSVRWFVTPENTGTISPSENSMVYTAPNELVGLVTLTAIINGEDTAYADIDISDCACYWEINAPDGNHTGLISIANLSPGGLVMVFNQAKSNPGPPNVSVVVSQFNGMGSYDSVSVIYTDPGTSPTELHIWTSMDTAVAMPTMSISEYVAGDYMIGRISGELNQAIFGTDPIQYRRFTLSFAFRAEFSGGVNETICEGDSL